LPVALSKKDEDFIVSPAYDVFEIIDENELLPEYLMMWFSRKEFDRNAWFYTDADVRQGLHWDAFCNMDIPIFDITKQQEIVEEYNVIKNRISLNNSLIEKLEDTAQAIYRQWFVDFEFPVEQAPTLKGEEQAPTLKGEEQEIKRAGQEQTPPVGGWGAFCEAPRVLNSADPFFYRRLYEKSVDMRNNPTKAENIVWDELK
jgi:restriction endonuclease S subunit